MLSAYVSAAKGGKVPLPSQSECSTTPVVSGLPPAVVTVVTSTGSLGAQGDVVDGTSKFMLSGLDAKDRCHSQVMNTQSSFNFVCSPDYCRQYSPNETPTKVNFPRVKTRCTCSKARHVV
jgi:hypothetical protein